MERKSWCSSFEHLFRFPKSVRFIQAKIDRAPSHPRSIDGNTSRTSWSPISSHELDTIVLHHDMSWHFTSRCLMLSSLFCILLGDILSSYALLCRYVLLCHVTWRRVMSFRHVALCYATLRYVTLRFMTSSYAMACFALSCYVSSCRLLFPHVYSGYQCCTTLHCVTLLHYVAPCCSTLQYVTLGYTTYITLH